MSDIFKPLEFKSRSQISTSKLMIINKEIEDMHSNNPIFKATYPLYLYKPPFGYPRNVNVVFLREIAKNPYVASVIKSIKDQAAETRWRIKLKEGLKETQQLKNLKKKHTEFFKNPNSDNETFSSLLRKLIPDILVLDSGVINKIYNKEGKLCQLRVIDGGSILKNPTEYGSLDIRADIISDTSYPMNTGKGYQQQKQEYKLALSEYNSYGYDEQAAYFQFAYGVNYSVPIPFGKKEIIYLMENPATETIYSTGSCLQNSIDVVLNLIYSGKATLDLFLNSNIPQGIIQLAEANNNQTKAFSDRLYEQQYSGYDEYGIQRKINGKIPVVGNPNVSFVPFNVTNKDNMVMELQEWFTKVLWSNFGVTSSEMGFTAGDSRATDQSQQEVNARKAVRPRLNLIANHINDQILPELEMGDCFEFEFVLGEEFSEKEKWDLYEKKIQLGVMTAEQVAIQEGIDYDKTELEEDFNNEDEELKSNKNPCWKGYEMQGTKIKDGKEVPNCVPIQNKSIDTQSGGEGISDTPLVPVENSKKNKKGVMLVDDLIEAIEKEFDNIKE